jgi:hypothetical protein
MANKALIESITYMPSGILLDFTGNTALVVGQCVVEKNSAYNSFRFERSE